MVQDILPNNSENYGTAAVEAGKLPVQPYQTSAHTATITSVASTTSTVQVLAANETLNSATFYNASTQICYLSFDASATSSHYSVQIAAGGTFSLPQPVFNGVISATWASANGNLIVTTY